jgi:23S rRNA pseudouridine1911/1915/1917 synthase
MVNEQNKEETLFIVSSSDVENYKRIDLFLTSKIPDISRNLLKKLFEKGHIFFKDESKLELKKAPKEGQEIIVRVPPPELTDIEPQNIPLDIVFEDEHLIIINKQAGLVIHPAAGNRDGTLVNAILYHCPDLKGIGNEKRPGIVHRLDKGTTGIMVVAKSQKCHEGLVNLFSNHDIKRKYEAIVMGVKMESSGNIETLIGRSPHNRLKMTSKVNKGKEAITYYQVLNQFDKVTHMEFTLETGRTHQIRVHASECINAPLLCDQLYGTPKMQIKNICPELKVIAKNYEHPLLHAKLLGFTHPMTGKELFFEAEAPEPFKSVLALFPSLPTQND